MRCSSHRDITNVAIDHLGIKRGDFTRTILRNICSPDRVRRHNRRERYAPHHWGRHQDIIDYVFQARICYLNNNLKLAGKYLAWALHLIQDHCISTSNHDTLERSIAKEHVEDYIKFSEFEVLYSFKDLEEYIYGIAQKDNPKEAIISALCHTMTALKSVVAERRRPPSNLLKSIRSLTERLEVVQATYRKIEEEWRKKAGIKILIYNLIFLPPLLALLSLVKIQIGAIMFITLLSELIICAVSCSGMFQLLDELQMLKEEEHSLSEKINIIKKEIAWHNGNNNLLNDSTSRLTTSVTMIGR